MWPARAGGPGSPGMGESGCGRDALAPAARKGTPMSDEMNGDGRCHLHGCPRAATSTCRVCGRSYCDQHMLVAQVADDRGELVTTEVCFADLGGINQPDAQGRVRVTHWHRKSEPS